MTNNYKESFEKSRIAGSIAAGALDEVAKIVKPGISTDEIDKLCYDFLNDAVKCNMSKKKSVDFTTKLNRNLKKNR